MLDALEEAKVFLQNYPETGADDRPRSEIYVERFMQALERRGQKVVDIESAKPAPEPVDPPIWVLEEWGDAVATLEGWIDDLLPAAIYVELPPGAGDLVRRDDVRRLTEDLVVEFGAYADGG